MHRYLDGDLPLEELTPEERREVAAYQEAIRETAAVARRETAPDLTPAVMARVREAASEAAGPAGAREEDAAPGGLLGRAWAWLWFPRPVRVRPAYPLAAAAVVAMAVVGVAHGPEAPGPVEVADRPHADGEVLVQFRLDEPDASSVRLAGSFTGWEQELVLHETSPGVWSAVVPLPPGVHDYAFIVDGEEWRPDPAAPRVDDGFGGENSRLAVLLPDEMPPPEGNAS